MSEPVTPKPDLDDRQRGNLVSPEENSLGFDPWFEQPALQRSYVNWLTSLKLCLLPPLFVPANLIALLVLYKPFTVPLSTGRLVSGVLVGLLIFVLPNLVLFYACIRAGYRTKVRFLDRCRAYALGALPPRSVQRRWHISVLGVCLLIAGTVVWAFVALCIASPGEAGSDGENVITVSIGISVASVVSYFLSIFVAELRDAMTVWQRKGAVPNDNEIAMGELKALQPAKEHRFVMAHWADLHLTSGDEIRRMDRRGLGGNKNLKRLIEKYRSRLAETDLIVVTGDTTDAGLGEEWRNFFEICGDLLCKMVLVPGNHDINVTDARSFFVLEDDDFLARRVRMIRWLCAADRIQGGRSCVLGSTDTLVSFRRVLQKYASQLRQFIESPPFRTYERRLAGRDATVLVDVTPKEVKRAIFLPGWLWEMSFPLIVSVPGTALSVIVLDSNDTSSNVVTNAFGRCSEEQLFRLNAVLTLTKTVPSIVALHHHLGVPSWVGLRREDLESRFLSLINGVDIVRALQKHGGTVVLNGHRHVGYMGQILDDHGRRLEVVSASSTALGDSLLQALEAERRRKARQTAEASYTVLGDALLQAEHSEPGFRLLTLSWGADHSVCVAGEKWLGL